MAADIGDGQRTWLVELDGVELYVFGDVGPAFRPEISQQANFTAASGFADGGEIEPAVVVVIQSSDSPSALPAEVRKWNALEALALDVSPQADAGRARMSEGEIHPAVFVEVKGDDADGGRKVFLLEVESGKRSEFAFARIQVDGSAVAAAGENEIDGAVVVEVGRDEASPGGVNAEAGFRRDSRERAVTVVAPEDVVRLCSLRRIVRRHGDVEIEVAVVVVIDEREANAAFFAANSHFLCYVFKLAVTGVAEETNSIGETDGEIGVAVVIEITGGAAEAAPRDFETGCLRDVVEMAVAEIVEQAAGAAG